MFPPQNTSPNQTFREPYRQFLFVGQADLLAEIERWATDAVVRDRLFNVKAPPGHGKTWLLNEAKRRFTRLPQLFPIWADANELIRLEAIEKWLEGVVAEARRLCPQVRNYNAGVPAGHTIRALVEDLCEHCYPAYRPLLIVDALDEVPPDELRPLEQRLLAKFLEDNNCVRILVGTRSDHRLGSSSLRRDELSRDLSPLQEPEKFQQLQKRAEDDRLGTPLPAELLELIPPYDWQTAGFNSFLTVRAARNRQDGWARLLSADDLRDCRRAVIGRTLDDRLDGYLWRLSELDDIWTEEKFARLCRLSVSVAGEIVQEFYNIGIVTRRAESSLRREIVEGLRKLMRAERAQRGM